MAALATSTSNVLVIGDTHAPIMKRGYVDFPLQAKREFRCNRIVHIGDVVSWETMSYHEKDLDLWTPKAEYKKAKRQVAQLYKAFPNVQVMIGNHDHLPQRKARSFGISDFLLRDFNDLWGTPKWSWHKRKTKLSIDGVLYAHGDRGKKGIRAAYKNAVQNFHSYVQGHLHSQGFCEYFANEDRLIFGLATGCGMDAKHAAMEYGLEFDSKPVLGCGVVLGGTEGYFIPWIK